MLPDLLSKKGDRRAGRGHLGPMQSKAMESAHWDLPSEPVRGHIWIHMGLDLSAAGQLMIEKEARWALQGLLSGPPLGRATWVAVSPQEFSLTIL